MENRLSKARTLPSLFAREVAMTISRLVKAALVRLPLEQIDNPKDSLTRNLLPYLKYPS